jgi:hypothetical protein
MYVRLAAVAAHLEPKSSLWTRYRCRRHTLKENALAKCMMFLMLEGRTILFVSHNMAAPKALIAECFKGGSCGS